MPITSRFVLRSTISLLGVGFAVLLFIVGASIWLGERAQRHFNDVIEARDLRTAANLFLEGLYAAESSQRGYILTGNEIYLAPYENAKLVAQNELERLAKALSVNSERSSMVSRLRQVTQEKFGDMDASIGSKSAGLDAEALSIVGTNRGKALMDEANVFVTAIVLSADDHLTDSVAEQKSNAGWLRWTSIAGGLIIILVVCGVTSTVHRYTNEITAARDEVRRNNETLEARVDERTYELARARDRAEVLLTEVNHRVANSLTLVSSLVRLQMGVVSDDAARSALAETQTRIQAIAEMHKHLFTSGNVGLVAVDEYLSAVLAQLETAMKADSAGIRLNCAFEPFKLATSDCINVGIIVTEWVTNAYKYAYMGSRGEVRVRLVRQAGAVEVTVEDDGVGRNDDMPAKGSGLGTRIVSTIAASMAAEVSYRRRQPGTEAWLRLRCAA